MTNTEKVQTEITEIYLQPSVFFQIADYRQRCYGDQETNAKRTVGGLMGVREHNRLVICNSFPAPFAENESSCYIDDTYMRKMADMYKQVFYDEELIGYYTTDPQFRSFDNDLATRIYNLVGKDKCYLLNVDCLEQGNYQEPFHQLYTIEKIDNVTTINPSVCQLHWSQVEKVVLQNPFQRRDPVGVSYALDVMMQQLRSLREYLQRPNADLAVVDRVQSLLNETFEEPARALVRKTNDNAVKVFMGELVKVCTLIKQNQRSSATE